MTPWRQQPHCRPHRWTRLHEYLPPADATCACLTARWATPWSITAHNAASSSHRFTSQRSIRGALCLGALQRLSSYFVHMSSDGGLVCCPRASLALGIAPVTICVSLVRLHGCVSRRLVGCRTLNLYVLWQLKSTPQTTRLRHNPVPSTRSPGADHPCKEDPVGRGITAFLAAIYSTSTPYISSWLRRTHRDTWTGRARRAA